MLDNCNSSETHLKSFEDRHQEYANLNYQPTINDKKINSLVVKSKNSIELMRNTLNIPCILVGISINGSDLWTEGMGYSDVENRVKCHKHSAFRLSLHKYYSLFERIFVKLISKSKYYSRKSNNKNSIHLNIISIYKPINYLNVFGFGYDIQYLIIMWFRKTNSDLIFI